MAARHRKKLEKMSAPIIAWLIDHCYVGDDCGILELTHLGYAHIREAVAVASRDTQGMKAVPVPAKRERLPIRRERL